MNGLFSDVSRDVVKNNFSHAAITFQIYFVVARAEKIRSGLQIALFVLVAVFMKAVIWFITVSCAPKQKRMASVCYRNTSH